jgi:hypothetical protein
MYYLLAYVKELYFLHNPNACIYYTFMWFYLFPFSSDPACPLQHILPAKRMFPFFSCWRTGLLLLLLLAVAVKESWQTEEKTCDLVGDKGKESEKELALVTRLKPLFNKR